VRLWTLHPRYLDAKGLVALWREALLAQAVLRGQTRGYTSHPQLIRFRETATPVESIARYLRGVHDEGTLRGYRFDAARIAAGGSEVAPIEATSGQLDYERSHLKRKLQARAPSWLAALESGSLPEAHSLFRIIPGPVAAWEVTG
jgi:hypothetical protein